MNKTFRVFFDIFIGYILLIPNLLVFTSLFQNLGFYKYFFLILISIWNSIIFHYLTLFIHAAAHFNIYPQNRRVNDVLSNILLGYIFLMPIKSYRKKHFKHHKYIGTNKDPEDSYTYNLTALNFLKWFCFYHPIKKFFFMFFTNKQDTLKINFDLIISIFVFFLFHISMFIYFLNISAIEFYFFMIFIPHIMLLPVINWIRTSVEHAPIETDKKSFSLRNFDNGNYFFTFLFGAAGFKFHDIHHINPGIHYLDLAYYKDKFELKKSDNYLNIIKKIYHNTEKKI